MRGGLRTHLRRALRAPRMAWAGALLWALAMSVSALLNISHWVDDTKKAVVVLVFLAGAILAFPPALFLARLAAGKNAGQRFAAAFLALGCSTAAVTASLFAVQHHAAFAARHAGSMAHGSGEAMLFSLAAGFYQFAALGLRLYEPVGLAALFAYALWFAARAR